MEPQYPQYIVSPKNTQQKLHTESHEWTKSRNLDVSDIEGAQPRPERSHFGHRHVNPLNPVYEWGNHVVITPPPEPRFLRDNLNISDIDGSKPKPSIYATKQTRDIMNVRDIEGTFAGWNTKHWKKVFIVSLCLIHY